MPRLQSLAAAILLIAGVAIAMAGPMIEPPQITIRWDPTLTDAIRSATETTLRLINGRSRGEGWWDYTLLDLSRPHLDEITNHPAVDDWLGISHERVRTVTPNAPPVRAWLQAHYDRVPVRWLPLGSKPASTAFCIAALFVARRRLVVFATAVDSRVTALLILATALRLWLIVGGGQFYWPDERQYREVQSDIAGIVAGNPDRVPNLFHAPAAVLFKLFGSVPATIEAMIGPDSRIPACFFGSCSIVSIWLIVAIARRLDATRDEAYLAGLLATGSTALLYMSRHLLNYDLALMCGLATVLIAVSPRGRAASLLTGVGAMATFLAYAGAWTLAGAAVAIHIADTSTLKDAVRRGLAVAAAAGAVVIALIVAYRLAGMSWLQSLMTFARTINQGEVGEGWSLPFEYLWHAEHLLLAAWLLAIAACGWRLRWAMTSRMTRAGLIGVVSIYAGLVLSSTVFRQFVVYGRLSRPLVPFLCLVSAAFIGTLLRSRTVTAQRMVVVVATLLVAVQAAANFRQPLAQEFPPKFIARVVQRYPEPRVFVNAKHLYPGPEPVTVPPGFLEVASAAHPLEFLPYQYEGYAVGQRRSLRASDLRMRAFVAP